MNRLVRNIFLVMLLWLGSTVSANSQNYPPVNGLQNTNGSRIAYDSQGRPIKAAKKDSLQHRDMYADSITIFYHTFDSTRLRSLDSSINDFTKRFPQPYTTNNLGNYGTAVQSLLFQPLMKAGWDAGFHQYDNYKFTVENTKLFQTTRPYTELAYLLGNKSEQFINVLHTQNHGNNFNFSLEYRFSNDPGVFKTQNVSHNNLRATVHYQSKNKRYETFFVLINNKAASSENGGLQNVKQLDSLALGNPYEVSTRLGIPSPFANNPFNTTVNTGNIYKETIFLLRHQYDFGQKDSLVTDSITYKLFYPRFRLQHNLEYSSNNYQFLDNGVVDSNYLKYFGFALTNVDTLRYRDKWSNLVNEFALISFPDKNNQSQFAKVGIALQNLKGTFGDTAFTMATFHNVYALGEYRNRTRNNIWDVEASGKLYLNGLNAGDYFVYASLKRQLSKKIGTLQLAFQNVNRTPSSIYSQETNFPVQPHSNFNKENIIRLFTVYENPRIAFRLTGDYYVVNNYTYFDSFFVAKQQTSLFNVLHVGAEKKVKLSKYFNWYIEAHLQQTAGDAPVHVPLFLTRNRIAFEGNFYKNLFLATGIEIRYYSNYKADNYSPFTGEFFYQNGYTTSNRPDINFFFNFRIKSFKCFTRIENLNTLTTQNGFGFTHYNYPVQQYPTQGLWFRLGIWWSFVN